MVVWTDFSYGMKPLFHKELPILFLLLFLRFREEHISFRRRGSCKRCKVHRKDPYALQNLSESKVGKQHRTACRADIAPLPAVDAMIRRIDRVLRCSGQHAVCQVHAFPSFPGVLISITYHMPVCKSPTHHPTAFSRRSRPDTGFLSSRNEEKEIKRKSKDIPLLSGENRGT